MKNTCGIFYLLLVLSFFHFQGAFPKDNRLNDSTKMVAKKTFAGL